MSMSQDSKKQPAAEAALEYVTAGTVIGVGTGSTVNFFIDGLARMSPPHRRRGLEFLGELAASRIARASRCWT
jgi:ribose 5-phosphate isomerase A